MHAHAKCAAETLPSVQLLSKVCICKQAPLDPLEALDPPVSQATQDPQVNGLTRFIIAPPLVSKNA